MAAATRHRTVVVAVDRREPVLGNRIGAIPRAVAIEDVMARGAVDVRFMVLYVGEPFGILCVSAESRVLTFEACIR